MGVYFKGTGKIWLDNCKVLVDGKETFNYIEFRKFPAKSDTLFDSGSGIGKIQLSKSNLKNIKFLGLVWGFVKYYHPNVAAGNFNFDYQLFRILRLIIDVESSQKRDELIRDWLKGLGGFETAETVNSPTDSDIKYLPDLAWLETGNFSSDLKDYLIKIKAAKRIKEHYYFDFHPWLGNPVFYNGNTYPNLNFPDTGYRLLALFRYWNTIQYFFPYKNNIGEDWENVLEEYIPKFINASNEHEYFFTTLELIGEIKDSHAVIWDNNNSLSKFLGENMAPIKISSIENKPVITGFYEQGKDLKGLFKKGDIIVKSNGREIEELTRERLKYTPGSNEASQLRDVYRNILRTNDKTIKIDYLQNNTLKSKEIETYSFDSFNIYDAQAGHTVRVLPDDILYIRNSTIQKEDLNSIGKN